MKRIFTLLAFVVAGTISAFAAGTAHLQLLHNIADPNVDSVTVYVINTSNGTVLDTFTDVKFRTASPFVNVPSGVAIKIAVTPGVTGSTLADTTPYGKTFVIGPFVADSNYIAVASGVSSSVLFAANPQGLSTALDLKVLSNARQVANDPSKTDLEFFNGVTDLGTANITFTSPANGNLVTNLEYGNFKGYVTLNPTTYIIKVVDSASGGVVKSYLAPLATSTGFAGLIFSSGFKTPGTNQGGAAFALFALDPVGGVHPLQEITIAHVQLINNSADTSLHGLDVYIADGGYNVIRKVTNSAFRTGTSFMDVPAGIALNIVFARAGSTGLIDSFKVVHVNNPLQTDSAYVAIENGVINTANFPANPDGLSTAFDLYVHAGRIFGSNAHKADLIMFHGCSDAPTIDVKLLLPVVATVVDNISYGSYDAPGYLTLDSANYVIEITDSSQAHVVQAYSAPLSLTVGAAAVVYASGFLTPITGAPADTFTVQVTLPNAITLALPKYFPVGIEETHVTEVKMFPNPANTVTRMNFSLEKSANVKFQLVSLTGEMIQNVDLGSLSAGTNNVDINVADLANGMYIMNLVVDNHTNFSRPVIVQK